MASQTPAIIELTDVHFSYEARRENGFSLTIPELRIRQGEHCTCIGPSGTGKTTLINLISGIFVPNSGTVRLADRRMSSMNDATRRALRIREIGMVFQEFELLDYLSALDNILLPYHISSSLRLTSAVRDRAREVAQSMRITHVLRRNPRRLSQGERQRVAIARAVITQPRLIIADEPTGNLDPETAGLTLDLLFDLADRHGATLLVVTHNHGILDRFERTIDMLGLQDASPHAVVSVSATQTEEKR